MAICIENVVLPSPTQWEVIIMGARNPLNSWSRYDSRKENGEFIIGSNDYDLLKRLAKAGTDHRKFMRMIPVMLTITAPLYWWKEFDTYKISTVANSCSTMHKIADKEFVLDDFSCEHLMSAEDQDRNEHRYDYSGVLRQIINTLNFARRKFIDTNDKKYWWQMIQLLPSSYNQRRTVMLNYEVLANIYKSRKSHKLDEWARHDIGANNDETPGPIGFCDWIETLPYSELITGEEE